MNTLIKCLIVLILLVMEPARADLSASAWRGRQLFMGYADWSNGIQATRNGLPHPFNACSSCHGATGEGRREGDTLAPPLAWETLTRERSDAPAFAGARAILRAITEGQGRNRPLGATMPLYRLSERDRKDLLAYLKMLGTQDDQPPGVTANSILIATRLPANDRGQAISAGLTRSFELINGRGGIHGRTLELRLFAQEARISDVIDAQPFLMVSGSASKHEENLLALSRIPHFGALDVPEQRVDLARSWSVPLQRGRSDLLALLHSTSMEECAGAGRTWLLAGSGEPGAREEGRSVFRDAGDLVAELNREAAASAGGQAVRVTSSAEISETTRLLTLLAQVPLEPSNASEHCMAYLVDGEPLQRLFQAPGWRVTSVSPWPAALLAKAHGETTEFWRLVGFATGRILAEALAQAGPRLHERAVLEALPGLNGMEIWPGIPLEFRSDDLHAFNAEKIASHSVRSVINPSMQSTSEERP